MQELNNENLQLNLIDTTSVFTKQINNNCHFDGSTLVYLAGAHILFHNVFQNGKQFLQRASDNEVVALAFHQSADLTILLVTRDPLCHVEFYFYDKKSVVVDIHQNLQIFDAIFLEKKRACLLVYDKMKEQSSLLIVTSHKKIKKVSLAQKCYKLSTNQRKVHILSQFGCYEMNIETEMLQKKKCYESIRLKNIITTETQSIILFDSNGFCYYMQNYKKLHSFSLASPIKKDKSEYQSSIRIGQNLLVAIKGQFTLSHYIITQNKLQFVNKFQYNQKIKGNIVALQSSQDQMNLAIAFQTTYKDQVRLQHFLFNLSALSNQKKFINPFIKLQSGGEAGEVSHLQCIIPSQMYCLTGPHVINYSYVEHIEKKHKYSIHQSPKSVSVHPLGHQLLCIFETAFKFYQKVEMQLVETWTEAMVCSCARYTDNGLLILCIYEQGSYNIVVYNPNTFRRLRNFNGLYLKHAITRIQFDQNDQQMILYSQKDLLVHRFKSGQRLSQFRQKRQMTDVNCIEYDSIRKFLLIASKQSLIICKKTQNYLLNFNSQRVVQIGHEITCIHINQNAESIFFGTSTGVILYCSYPLQICEQTINDERVLKINSQQVKVHSQPISDIIMSHNCKFLFVSIKGDGMSILRAKRFSGSKGGYNPFDISNYNFIETSSMPYLDNVHQKLKGLLQKRKTIFNELDEFKKEWQIKRINETKLLGVENKKKQLQYINNTLNQINECKKQHGILIQQLSQYENMISKTMLQNERFHYKNLLQCYEQNDNNKRQYEQIDDRCNIQWKDLNNKCIQNINEIHEQLQLKFRTFESTYNLMKDNLLNYRKRIQLQQQQQRNVYRQQIQYKKDRLKQQQQQLYRKNNQLKGQITKNRKQLQRYLNRKDFLENKKRFFIQELKYCNFQQKQLLQVKQLLQQQLIQLEYDTHKKQKRLRKYFLENQILIKYQLIHDNLTKQSNRQIQFIEQQHRKIRQNIGQLQKQILYVSQQRQKHKKQLQIKKKKFQQSKFNNRKLKQKRDFLSLQVQQIQNTIDATKTGKVVDQQSKNQEFMAIYHKFFVDRQLEAYLSNRQTKTDELVLLQNKRSQQGVKAVLQDHKQYLVKNMNLFEKYNTRVMDQINLTYLKYQTENYDLISQCNVRKEQINKKKRILHQLVDQIRQTNNHIAALHRSKPIHKDPHPPAPQLPFPLYEQAQQQQKLELHKQKSESAMWKIKKSSYQVRKMLEAQKLKVNNSQATEKVTRRIQTAVLKKKPLESSHQQAFAEESLDVMNPIGFLQQQKKPQTAIHRYRKKQNQQARRLFSRNKSNSKPTTCTSHTKSKQSLFI